MLMFLCSLCDLGDFRHRQLPGHVWLPGAHCDGQLQLDQIAFGQVPKMQLLSLHLPAGVEAVPAAGSLHRGLSDMVRVPEFGVVLDHAGHPWDHGQYLLLEGAQTA